MSILFPIVCGFCVRYLFCYAVLCVLSSFVTLLLERTSWWLCAYWLMYIMSLLLVLPLPHGALDWSASCEFRISWSNSFTFLYLYANSSSIGYLMCVKYGI